MVKFSWIALLLTCAVACPKCGWADDEPAAQESSKPASAAEGDDQPTPTETPQGDAAKYDLKYSFTRGEVLRTEVVHRATVQTSIQGTSQTAETQSTSIKVWQINDVDAQGNVTFVHKVESIDMWQRAQGRQEIRYNSATDQQVPPGYEDAAAAVGVPLTTVTMDQRGKILKRHENRQQPTSMSTQMTMPLPEHPIAIGETWSSPVEIEVVLKDGATKKIQTRQVFTLEKVVEDLATIAVDSQVLTPIHDPAIEAQLIQRLSSGSVRFDVKAGRVLGQQLDLDRHVIGFSGPASSMHYVTRFTEQLLPAAEQTARSKAPRAAPIEKASPPDDSAAKKKSQPRR
jgi:hypothetical protein